MQVLRQWVIRANSLMKVRTVDILNPFSLATFSGGKDAVLDIRARDESGRDLQVEIQLRQLEAANHRMTDNICRLYADQIKKAGNTATTNLSWLSGYSTSPCFRKDDGSMRYGWFAIPRIVSLTITSRSSFWSWACGTGLLRKKKCYPLRSCRRTLKGLRLQKKALPTSLGG